MAKTSDTDEPRRGTPVPPRGGRKPARPSGGATSGRPGSRPSGARPGGGNRTAANRRAAVAEARRKRQTTYAVVAIGVVVAVVAVFIIVKVAGGGKSTAAGSTGSTATVNTPVSAAQYSQYTTAPVATLAAAAKNFHATALVGPTVTNDPPITKAGLPHVLYIGAEYCPYCATERWPMVLALSKFGTFSGLSVIHSSPTDVYPNTATFSFYKSHYTSKYLAFDSVEELTVSKKPLQNPTKAQQALISKYDTQGSIPFVYLNGKATIIGAEYSPTLLHGMSFPQIVSAVHAGTSALASNIYANAGMIISDLCQVTGGQPGNVCRSFPKPLT